MFIYACMAALAGALALVSCDHNPLLAGALDEDCDPSSVLASDGGAGAPLARTANCQVKAAVCCRASAQAPHTTCQYPEDCYVAPLHGPCATAADCSDTQSCVGGACTCTLGGPPCANPTSGVSACCAAGQICLAGACSAPQDAGGPTPVSDGGA